GRIPGAMTPTPPPQSPLAAAGITTSQQRIPTPVPKTIAWGQSPMPQSRPATGATMPGSPESDAAASVRASMVHSKAHPIVTGDLADDLDLAPAPARGKKGIFIVAATPMATAATMKIPFLPRAG